MLIKNYPYLNMFLLILQVGDDTFGRNTVQNFKDNSVNAGHTIWFCLFAILKIHVHLA